MKTVIPFCLLAVIAPVVGCSNQSSTPPSQANMPSAPLTHSTENALASGTAAPAEPGTLPAADEVVAGLDDPLLRENYQTTRKQLADQPHDVNAQLQLVHILQNVGFARMQKQEVDKGYRAFAASSAAASQLVEHSNQSGEPIPGQARQVLATAFYNGACAASRAGEVDSALQQLEQAMSFGFDDLPLLERDEDLAAVRQHAEFSAKAEAWRVQGRERTQRQIREELASAESFPFDFSLTDVAGKRMSLADHRGKVVIVDIWGTWCPPCRAEIPSFVKLQETYGEKGFQMLGLNSESGTPEEAAQRVTDFITAHGMNYPCALIDEATQNQIPELEGYPTTLFIDRSGKVRLKAVGLHPYEYLEAVVQALLEEAAPPPTETTAAR